MREAGDQDDASVGGHNVLSAWLTTRSLAVDDPEIKEVLDTDTGEYLAAESGIGSDYQCYVPASLISKLAENPGDIEGECGNAA